jgi:acyl-CoA reductase-like NAD-dependent aldehyde dehydrogenase
LITKIPEQPWGSYIGGEWHDGREGRVVELLDPGRSELVSSRYSLAGPVETERAVEAVAAAFPSWSLTPPAERASYVYRLIELWRERSEQLAEVTTREMGKPLRESRSEAARGIAELQFWAAEALRLGDRTFESTRCLTEAFTMRQPLGPVAAIAPWNFPILTPIRKVVPALICGCTVVLKPALQAPGASVLLMRMLEDAALPAGVANLLVGGGREVGEALVRHRSIAGITFTGSTEVGLRIGTLAAERNARVQLEMGGKNAAVVARCGDVEQAAREIVAAAFTASGQRCTSISRIVVPEPERQALEEALVRHAEALKIGHGLDEGTEMGPLVNADQLRKVEYYVGLARDGQGKILTGGRRTSNEGLYFAPTIISDVRPGTPLALDEIFGPVLVVIPVEDYEQAVQVNNEVRYGLTSAIFTDDADLAHDFTVRSQAGMVHVNHGTSSEGHLPFGGWKESGQGAYGIGATAVDFYTSLKAVYRMYRQPVGSASERKQS